VQTREAVVSRDDDAGSCSQAQSSMEGALYDIVVSKPGFFYRPKVADIFEIFFLSSGSDKI
jgi:hypothetical protein